MTLREVRDDNTLGESESFSVYESEQKLNRTELRELLENAITSTNKEK